MTAGRASMQALDEAAYARLETLGATLRARLNETLARRGVPGVVIGDGSLFTFVMTAAPPRTYRDTVDPAAEERLQRLFVHLLDEGVLVNGNGLACLSTPMGEREIDEIVEATDRAAARLANEG
jgi:glutamate-1-semialdehyde 2,1-aminomutase